MKIPEGWKLVPLRMTEDMLAAAASAPEGETWQEDLQNAWDAALEAAPEPVVTETSHD